jgi:hypothetical protein
MGGFCQVIGKPDYRAKANPLLRTRVSLETLEKRGIRRKLIRQMLDTIFTLGTIRTV